jgi:uncharacterized protein (TIGR02300 family)
MKKAATKTSGSVDLGNKRTCKKCQAKFYDFNKEEVSCPKCGHVMTQQDFLTHIPLKSEPRKKSVEKVTTEGLMQSDDAEGPAADPFDNEEDLSEDSEEVVEDIEVDDEDENDY